MSRGRSRLVARAWPLALVVLVGGLIAIALANRDDVARPGPFQALLVGKDAPVQPKLSGPTLAGETLAIESLRGRPVLVNVWASW